MISRAAALILFAVHTRTWVFVYKSARWIGETVLRRTANVYENKGNRKAIGINVRAMAFATKRQHRRISITKVLMLPDIMIC